MSPWISDRAPTVAEVPDYEMTFATEIVRSHKMQYCRTVFASGYFLRMRWHNARGYGLDVIAWMPIPEPLQWVEGVEE
jgi:hypothetical protein